MHTNLPRTGRHYESALCVILALVLSTPLTDCGGDKEDPPHCGNGEVEEGEECDDSNTVTEVCQYGETTCTICAANCQTTAGSTSYCGDDLLDPQHEQCDSSLPLPNGECSADCSVTCEATFGDCTDAAGCETDLAASSTNCGRCSHDCLGATCDAGQCAPTPLALGDESVATGFMPASRIVVDHSYVYWSAGDTIFRAPKLETFPSVEVFATDQSSPQALHLSSSRLYWTTIGTEAAGYEDGEVVEAPTDLSEAPATIASSVPSPSGITIHQGALYWLSMGTNAAQYSNGALFTAALEQPFSPTPVFDDIQMPIGLAASGTILCWGSAGSQAVDYADGQVLQLGTDPTPHVVTLASDTRRPWAVQTDGTRVYWLEFGSQAMVGADGRVLSSSTGSDPTPIVLASDQTYPFAIALDETHVYWGSFLGQYLRRVPKDAPSEPPEELIPNAYANVWGIAVDDLAVYWLSAALDTTYEVFWLAK